MIIDYSYFLLTLHSKLSYYYVGQGPVMHNSIGYLCPVIYTPTMCGYIINNFIYKWQIIGLLANGAILEYVDFRQPVIS